MTARCLDLTRLVSRAGLGAATGVDRVERAYLSELLHRPDPLWALVRTATGFSLLDRAGAAQLARHIDGDLAWGRPDLAARLSRRLSPQRRGAEATVRRLALASCLRPGLARLLRGHLPEGASYLNTGHSNLTERSLTALRGVPGLRIAVLIHDTIPLDHPQYQRPGTVAGFEARLAAVARHADLVICNSHQTERDVTRHAARHGRQPPCLTAHLGIDLPRPDPAALPPGLDLSRPYFVTVGTIEPRKNHAFLLDLWEALAAEAPPPLLYIVGRRGWNNAAVFARLDARPAGVLELPDLGDGAMAALVAGAAGLLFPSHAEGFGLPPVEAAALGVPVVCAPLDITREILGDLPIYAETSDLYHWRQTIRTLTTEKEDGQRAGRTPTPHPGLPTWTEHFNRVLTRV